MLLERYREHFGAEPQVMGEANGVSVVRIQGAKGLRAEPTTELFVTAGMSARAMNTPEKVPSRVELMMAVPGNWEELYGKDFFVIDTLLTTAAYPFSRNTHLAAGHTIPAGQKVAPATEMNGWVLTAPLVLEKAPEMPSFLLMTPIYPLELALARSSGTNVLLDRIFTMLEVLGLDWSFLMLPERPPVLGGDAIFVR